MSLICALFLIFIMIRITISFHKPPKKMMTVGEESDTQKQTQSQKSQIDEDDEFIMNNLGDFEEFENL